MGEVSFYFRIQDNKNASYSPCYDDCAYVGTYKIDKDVLYFEGEDYSDYIASEIENNPEYKRDKVNVRFNIKEAALVTDKGEVYIKEKTINEPVTAPKNENNYTVSSKPTVEDIINVLHKNLFVYKHRDGYYVSFDFEYRGLDDDGNPTFRTEESEFVPKNSIANSPAEVIMQSFNQVQYLRIVKGTHFVVKEHLQNDYVILKKKSIHDNLRFFKIAITNIKRDKEGRIIEADVYANTQGPIKLSMFPKNR